MDGILRLGLRLGTCATVCHMTCGQDLYQILWCMYTFEALMSGVTCAVYLLKWQKSSPLTVHHVPAQVACTNVFGQ